MREVCINGSVDLDGAGSGSPVHKPELEKVNTPKMQEAITFDAFLKFSPLTFII